jgi:hypothetical protein
LTFFIIRDQKNPKSLVLGFFEKFLHQVGALDCPFKDLLEFLRYLNKWLSSDTSGQICPTQSQNPLPHPVFAGLSSYQHSSLSHTYRLISLEIQ